MQNDVFQPAGFEGNRVAVQSFDYNLQWIFAFEWQSPSQAFVHDATERIDVGADIHRPAFRLLRTDVRRRSDKITGFRRAYCRVVARDSKVEKLDDPPAVR